MKKNVKTLLALVLTLAMVLSTNLVLPVQAAETVDSSLTYELDFSELDTTSTATGNRGLKSKSISGVNIKQHYIAGDVPLTKVTKNGVEGIYFNGKNGFMVESSDGSAFGSENISVEMWIYKDNIKNNGRLFNLMQKKGSGTILEWYVNNVTLTNDGSTQLVTDGTANLYNFSDYHYLEDWNHVVITRSVDTTNNSAVTKLYSNGVLKGTYNSTLSSAFAAPQAIWVGNYDSTKDIGTALASLRVYNKALTLNEVDAKYDAEKADYGVGLRDERMTYELDFSGLQATGVAGNKGLKSNVSSVWSSHYVNSTDDLTVKTLNGVQALELGPNTGIRVQSDGVGTNDLTFEMWVYKKSDSASKGSMFTYSRSVDGSKKDELQMYFTKADTMSFMPCYATTDNNTRDTYTFSDYHYDDDWEHITITRTYDEAGTTATTKLYSNGVKIKEYTKTDLLKYEPSNQFSIGEYSSTNDTDVAIGAFRVYGAELTESEVKEKYDLQKETYGVADRGRLTYDLDFSNYETDGTFKNATTTRGVTINQHYSPDMSKITVEEIEGVEALKFDAEEGFLIDSTDGSAFGSKDLTIEMWAYKYDGASKGSLFKLVREKTSSSEMEMYFNNKEFDVNGSLVLKYGYYNTTDENEVTTEVSTSKNVIYNNMFEKDAWQHIVFSRTVDTDKAIATTNVYVNGQNVYTATTNDATFVTPYRLFIGDYNSGTTLNAALADLKVYNVELDADEIKDKFLEEAPNYNNVTYYANDEEIDGLTTDMSAVKSSVWVLNTENKAVDMMAFAAVYQNDVLVKIVPATQEVAANDVWNFDIDLTGITVDANTKIKTFVWTEDGLKPLYTADDQVIQCL